MVNKLRIIGGEWRSRSLHFNETPGLRPTPDRIRETLFNWLQYDIIGSRCLDLFAGSGALGFEAASRGAKSVLQIEQNPIACHALQENASRLNAHQITMKNLDVFDFLAGPAETFDIVFLDPPFAQGMAETTCQWLEKNNWLMPQAKVYVETESNLNLAHPESWTLLKNKTTGGIGYRLFCKELHK